MTNINGRVANLYPIFINRAEKVTDHESEEYFNEVLEDFVARIEEDLAGKLMDDDYAVLYNSFGKLKQTAANWRTQA